MTHRPPPDVPRLVRLNRAEERAYSDAVQAWALERLREGAAPDELIAQLDEGGHPYTTKYLVSAAQQELDRERLGITPADLRALGWATAFCAVLAVLIGVVAIPADWGGPARFFIIVGIALALSSGARRLAYAYFRRRNSHLGRS